MMKYVEEKEQIQGKREEKGQKLGKVKRVVMKKVGTRSRRRLSAT